MPLLTENEADKSKDVFVGTWRPPFYVVLRYITIIPSLLGHETEHFGRTDEQGNPSGAFRSEHRARERWLAGDFDTAVYQRVEP